MYRYHALNSLFVSSRCGLILFSVLTSQDIPTPDKNLLIEAEEIAARQIEEDLLEYGGITNPSNPEETEYIDLAHQKANANEFKQELLGRGLKTNITESGSNWTQENSVFSKWLDNSANPTPGVARLQEVRQEKEEREARTRDLETREIEVFRNVQVDTTIKRPQESSQRIVEGHAGPSEIYRRNILDRYPRIPQYLASRLAEANTQRIERLLQLRARNRRLRFIFSE